MVPSVKFVSHGIIQDHEYSLEGTLFRCGCKGITLEGPDWRVDIQCTNQRWVETGSCSESVDTAGKMFLVEA